MGRAFAAMMPFTVLIAGLCSAKAGPANDTTPLSSAGRPIWADGSAAEAARLRTFSRGKFQALDGGTEEGQPQSGPRTLVGRNPQGLTATYLPQGVVASTATEPFFLSLGTNGRTCLTCH